MKLLGCGSYIPPIKLTNEELEKTVDTNAKWIYDNLGIKERRIAKFTSTSDMAAWAGYDAVIDSGVDLRDIGMLIVATSTPDGKAPSVACQIQGRIGVYNAVCFDVNAVCSGFLYAMSIADKFLNTYENILVIGVDRFSSITDWTRRDAVFFGDGAGAAVFTRGGESYFRLYSDSRGNGFRVQTDFFEMDGRAVYNKAVSVLPNAICDILVDADMVIEDIDAMIPHQPSIRILKETARCVGLPWDKVHTNMDKYANTSAATIPILLDEVRPKGNVLFAAIGSGWTWGAAILKI